MALPIPLPKADSPEEQRERTWDLLVAKPPVPQTGKPACHPGRTRRCCPCVSKKERELRWSMSISAAWPLTDSGMEDRRGPPPFLSGGMGDAPGSLARTTGTGPAGIVVLLRRAVAVNTKTGQHTLLRRYEMRELRGDFDDLYRLQESDYIANAELPQTIGSALHAGIDIRQWCRRSARRRDLNDASAGFQPADTRRIWPRNDALLAARDKLALDDDLPNDLREVLFAIRGHIAGATGILDPENRVRLAVTRAGVTVRELEALVAWVDGTVPRAGSCGKCFPRFAGGAEPVRHPDSLDPIPRAGCSRGLATGSFHVRGAVPRASEGCYRANPLAGQACRSQWNHKVQAGSMAARRIGWRRPRGKTDNYSCRRRSEIRKPGSDGSGGEALPVRGWRQLWKKSTTKMRRNSSARVASICR